MTPQLFAFDVDGVLTDGRLYYGTEGEALKVFHAQDGLGLVLLSRLGVRLAALSGRSSPALVTRLAELGISDQRLGISDKRAALTELAAQYAIPLADVVMMGDDLIDTAAMQAAGYAIAPATAVPEAKALADYITPRAGGMGAVRDAAEHIAGLMGRPLAGALSSGAGQ